jgi:hypothetical protein
MNDTLIDLTVVKKETTKNNIYVNDTDCLTVLE